MKTVIAFALALWCESSKSAAEAIIGRRVSMTISIGGQPLRNPILIGLFDLDAPRTANNFYTLCTQTPATDAQGKPRNYLNSSFHRIISGFMAQGGDFTHGDGTGGVSIYGKHFNDENFDVRHAPGVLSMANAGPNTNGSQFFLTFVSTPHLDGKHTVFGRVLSGSATLQAIAAQGTPSGKPHAEVRIVDCVDASLRI